MKKKLFLICFLLHTLTLVAQYETIVDNLPMKFKKGVIIYHRSDTSVFVFKARDYIKLIGGLDSIAKESHIYIDYIKLNDTLKRAINGQYLVVGDIFTKGQDSDYKIFPIPQVIMDLFSSKKIILFQKTSNGFDKINYTSKKRNGIFSVSQKKTKTIFFEIGYKRIEHKSN